MSKVVREVRRVPGHPLRWEPLALAVIARKYLDLVRDASVREGWDERRRASGEREGGKGTICALILRQREMVGALQRGNGRGVYVDICSVGEVMGQYKEVDPGVSDEKRAELGLLCSDGLSTKVNGRKKTATRLCTSTRSCAC